MFPANVAPILIDGIHDAVGVWRHGGPLRASPVQCVAR
jgi:hypothetical protein